MILHVIRIDLNIRFFENQLRDDNILQNYTHIFMKKYSNRVMSTINVNELAECTTSQMQIQNMTQYRNDTRYPYGVLR